MTSSDETFCPTKILSDKVLSDKVVDDQSDGTVSCVDVGDNNLVNETASEVQVGYDNDELQIDDTLCNESQDTLLNINYGDKNCNDLEFSRTLLTKNTILMTIEDITRKLSDFNLQNDFPIDRGHFRGDISDSESNLKRAIIDCGPCRPREAKYFVTTDGTKNFSCQYYNKIVDNVTIPRLWLCYSPSLRKPYCDDYWLFADRSNCNRAWIDGVSGDIQNMADKIARHEKSKTHINTASITDDGNLEKQSIRIPKC